MIPSNYEIGYGLISLVDESRSGDLFSRFRLDLVVNTLVVRAAMDGVIRVFGGDQFRPLLHVRDAARAVIANLETSHTGVFNLNKQNVRIIDLAYQVRNHFRDIEIERTEMKFQDARNYRVNSGKAVRVFRFQTMESIDGGIGKGVMPMGSGDAFEQELRNLSSEGDDVRGAARTAFFLKGTVRGEYLLTAAYDSDKDECERLLRDIQPDRFYPIYGDSAAKTFDALGFHSVWVCDHVYGVPLPQLPIFEAWTELAAVAAITERVELGTLVTPPFFRNPAVLAKQIATLDQISGGRASPGFGAGWFAAELKSYGLPFPKTGERLRAPDEALTILSGLWTQEKTSFEGRHFRVNDAFCQPKPVRKPRIRRPRRRLQPHRSHRARAGDPLPRQLFRLRARARRGAGRPAVGLDAAAARGRAHPAVRRAVPRQGLQGPAGAEPPEGAGALERIAPAHVDSAFHFGFQAPDEAPNPLLRLERVAAGYGNTPVLSNVTLTLSPGDRIGLLGVNGAGKSTLIKLLAGEVAPLSGVRDPARDLNVGYFAQHQLEQL